MADFQYIKCKQCGSDIVVREGQQQVSEYHKACAWYEIPCDICGKPMSVHRDWVNLPKAHKECKDAQASNWYERPCDYCGRPIRVHKNAVSVQKLHKKCAAKVQQMNSNRKSGPQRQLRVFLCHSSNDKPAVRELYRRLCAENVDAWLDEEKLLPGHDWHLEITRAVRASDIVIICLSCTSINKSGYVQKEIKFALDVAEEQPEGTIFLIPIKLEECNMPERLCRWQWVSLFEENGYEKLIRALQVRASTLTP